MIKLNLNFALGLAATVLLVFVYTFDELQGLRASNVKSLDVRICGYYGESAKDLFTGFSAKDRELYLFQERTIDMLFPLSYFIFLALASFKLLYCPSAKNKRYFNVLIGIISGTAIFDYLENIGAIYLLGHQNNDHYQLVNMVSGFTQTKFLFLILSLIILTLLLAYRIYKWLIQLTAMRK